MATFAKEFRATFETTGAVLPSSRFLARAITRHARSVDGPKRLLEVGPGTGAFTDQLIRHLKPTDEFVVVELNDRFVGTLRHRLETEPAWKEKRSQVRLIHDTIEALDATEKFDAVVCGLPFNNFDPSLVEQLVGKMIGHVSPGGTFSFFEYLAIRKLKAPFVGKVERERLAAVADVLGGYLMKHRIASDRVIRNVPPAVAHHLRVESGGESGQ